MLKGEPYVIGGDDSLPIPNVGAHVAIALAAQEHQELTCGQTWWLTTDAQWRPLERQAHSAWRCPLEVAVHNSNRTLSLSLLPSDLLTHMVCDIGDGDDGNDVGTLNEFGPVGRRRRHGVNECHDADECESDDDFHVANAAISTI
jgi:hypothetical protein